MDFLKAEIAKRKATSVVDESGRPAKLLRRDDVERERERLQNADAPDASSTTAPPATAAPAQELLDGARRIAEAEEAQAKTLPPASSTDAAAELEASGKPEAFAVPPEVVVRRLRAKGQPIRLFGETDRERRLRLRALELIDERDERGGQQDNDMRKTLEGLEAGLALDAIVAKRAVGGDKSRGATPEGSSPKGGAASPAVATDPASPAAPAAPGAEVPNRESGDLPVDLSLLKAAPARIYPLIYFALKKVMREWEQSMEERSDAVKRSTQGKQAAAMQLQSAEYLKPLFKSLRKRELEPDVLKLVAEITHHMQNREYVKANDAYIRMSIGTAAWPIGVTAVGIHARSARERIHIDQVAHVLNDEVSRKWIQSLKRLLTFAQAIRPPADHSQRMG